MKKKFCVYGKKSCELQIQIQFSFDLIVQYQILQWSHSWFLQPLWLLQSTKMQLHTAGILCYFIQLVSGNLTENSDFFKLVQDLRHSLQIRLLFSFVTFDSFLVGLGRNQVNGASCCAQTAHKPVQTSSEKQTTGSKSLLF